MPHNFKPLSADARQIASPLGLKLPAASRRQHAQPLTVPLKIEEFFGGWAQEWPTAVGAAFNFLSALGDPSGFSSINPTGGRGGTPCVQIQETSVAASWGGFTVATADVRRAVAGCWFNVMQNPTGANQPLMQIAGPTGLATVRLTTAGVLQGVIGSASANYSRTFVNNQWYWITMLADYTTPNFRMRWFVYDESAGISTEETLLVSSGDTPADVSSVRYGQVGSSAQSGDATHVGTKWQNACYSLDLANFPIPPMETAMLAPNSVGNHNLGSGSFQKTGAVAITGGDTTSYQEIDEQPPSNTDFVQQTAIDATAYLEYGFNDFSAINTNQPVAVKVYTEFVGAGAGGYSVEARLFDGTETTDLFVGGNKAGVAPNDRSVCLPRIPSGSVGVWDSIAVDQLSIRFGYSGDVTPNPQLSGALLEVLVPIGGAIATTVYNDADTVLITITPSSVDVAFYSDAATVPITILASGTDTYTSTALLQDTATRSNTNSLGTPDVGPAYIRQAGANTGMWNVNGSVILLKPEGSFITDQQTSAINAADIDLTFDFQVSALGVANVTELFIGGRWVAGGGGAEDEASLRITWNGTNLVYNGYRSSHAGGVSGDVTAQKTIAYTAGTAMKGRLVLDGQSFRIAIWLASGSQNGWDIDEVDSSTPTGAGAFTLKADSDAFAPVWTIDNINVTSLLVPFTDQGSPTVTITPSGIDTAQFVAVATVPLTITPSATDFYGATDAATTLINIIPSGVDTAQFVDTAKPLINIIPSSVDVAAFVDAATALVNIIPSSVDVAAYVDTNKPIISIIPSSTDILLAVDAATVPITFTPSSTESYGRSDSATVPISIIPSVADILLAIDSGKPLINIIPSGTDFLTGAGNFDAATVPITITPIAYEVGDDGGLVPITITPALTFEAYTGVGFSTGTPLINVIPSSNDIMVYDDRDTAILNITPSSTEVVSLSSDGVAVITIAPSSSDVAAYLDTGTVLISIIPSAIEIRTILNYCVDASMRQPHWSVAMRQHWQAGIRTNWIVVGPDTHWAVNFRGLC